MTNPLRFEVPAPPDPISIDRIAAARAAARSYEQRFVESHRNALALGQLGLRALFILNGGALLVFPIYLVLLNIDLDAAFGSFLYASSLFVAGILLAAAATLCGYFAEIQRSRIALAKLRAVTAELHQSGIGLTASVDAEHAPVESIGGESAIAPGRILGGRDSRPGFGRWLRVAAIALAFASLFCFAGGAYFAAAAVITGTSQDSDTDATKV